MPCWTSCDGGRRSEMVIANSHEGVLGRMWTAGLDALFDRLPAGVPRSWRWQTLRSSPSARPSACRPTSTMRSRAPRHARRALDADYARSRGRGGDGGGAIYADLNDYLCTDVCGTVIGANLAYRDDDHLGRTFSARLAEPLRARASRRSDFP